MPYNLSYNIQLFITKINYLKALSTADRSNLIHDAFSLAKASYLPYATALNMTKYLVFEHDYVPWSVAGSKLISLWDSLYNRSAHPHFEVKNSTNNYLYSIS